MKRIVGLLGWLGVVLVLAGVILRFVKPEYQQWYQGLAIAGLVVTLLYTLSQWREIGRSFGGRNIKYGSVAFGSVVIMLGILVGVNWISTKQSKRIDLTQAKQFSLSDQTKKIVSSLTKPLDMKVFYQADQLQPYKDKLSEYGSLSKQLTVEYVDAEKKPTEAAQYKVQQYGTIILEYDGRTERTTTAEEQDLTNAIVKLTQGKTQKLYMAEGHGERDTAGSDRDGYSGIATALKNDNFDVAKLTLAEQPAVPDDATVVLIAGPKTDYLPLELNALQAYLKKGGKLMMLLDPPDRADSPPLTNLVAFAKQWGFNVGNDLVLDLSPVGQLYNTGPEMPLAAEYPSHPITEGFRLLTAYRLARSVTPIEGGTDGHTAQRVAETSKQSWAVADVKGLLTTHKVDGADPKKGDVLGPISLVAAMSAAADAAPSAAPDAPKAETRIVVAGDSDFADNYLLGFQGNRDFFMNAINWVAQQENMIAIRPRDPADRRITLTGDQGSIISWLTLAIIPMLLLGIGVWTWWRRR